MYSEDALKRIPGDGLYFITLGCYCNWRVTVIVLLVCLSVGKQTSKTITDIM